MKQRFSYLDLQIISNELNQAIGYRLQNIYDLSTSSRQFLLKFSQPDSKKLVMVDPGFRIHLTEYNRPTANFPSGFVTKLRKHIKSRRLNSVRLAPLNRMLVLSFGQDNGYHLVFEFFAGGNMILLDHENKILTLQRVVSATDTQSRCAVGEVYPLDTYLNASDDTADITEANVKSWLAKPEEEEEEEENEQDSNALQRSTDRRVGKKKNKPLSLKKVLYFKLPGIATGLIESSLRQHQINPDAKVDKIRELDSYVAIVNALKDAEVESKHLVSKTPVPGYILAKKNPRYDPSKDKAVAGANELGIDPHNIEYIYEEFQPFQPLVPEGDEYKLVETDTYTKAVDVYFSTLEATKLSMRAAHQEQVAEKRLAAAKAEKEKRVQGLTDVQQRSHKLGNTLLANADLVEEACESVRKLMNQGMDWTDLERLIGIEKSRDNPVAEIIALPLNLKKNKISVMLPEAGEKAQEKEDESESDSDMDSDSESASSKDQRQQRVKVEVDLGLTAWSNAGTYFDVKKTAAAKQERTVQTADIAYKSAEKKIKRDLKQALDKEQTQQTMQAVREPFWFEKFWWFMSSDGYLVLAGRDKMQNEILFRRQFKKHDILVGCDIESTSIGIIKNHMTADSVPPATLQQAGAFVAATSQKVWDSKMSPTTWWVRHHQVPKISAQGELITTERLNIKGEKNHMAPSRQDMGFGFLWIIDEQSQGKYSKPKPVVRESETQQVDEEEEDSDSEEEFPDTQIPEGPASQESPKPHPEEQPATPPNSRAAGDDEEAGAKPGPGPSGPAMNTEQTTSNSEEKSKELPVPPSQGKRMSAKERREQRKKRNAAAQDNNQDEEPMNEVERDMANLKTRDFDDSDNESSTTSSTPSGQKPPNVRGKKGKLKKMAQKYAHQDEEDRQKAMELLGATKGEEKAKAREDAQRQREEQERQKRERIKQQKQRELEKLQQAEQDDDTPQDDSYAFDLLVPRLAAGDQPKGVVPVFGPWQSMQRFKYKIKMQPGPVKKGKATKEMIRTLASINKTDPNCNDTDMPWPIELELIKNIRETDLLLPMCVSRVKISLPGAGAQGPKGKNNKKK